METTRKQLEKVLLNTTHLYGSIRGIAGNAIQIVPQLEATPVIESPKQTPAIKSTGVHQDSLF